MMFGAGTLSGLLGIGSGAFKVLAMDQVMRIPFKVSTTTSNFMIGVTAAASAGIYLRRGFVAPVLVMPVFCPPATKPLNVKLPPATFTVAPKLPIVIASPVDPDEGRLTTAPVSVMGPEPSAAPAARPGWRYWIRAPRCTRRARRRRCRIDSR